MENIFENAYFGKVYVTRDGRKAIYHKVEITGKEKWHYLAFEPITVNIGFGDYVYAPYEAYVNKNGKGYPENLKCYDLEDKNSPNYGNVIEEEYKED